MEIDIIDYTPSQYAVLSSRELEEIRAAQKRKDVLTNALQKKLLAAKQKMMDGGAFLSNIWAREEAVMRAEYEAEVKIIRDSLLFYLHYTGNAYDFDAGGEKPAVPYPVDYSLTTEERMIVLRDFYLEAYTDPLTRFETYKADTFARTYLGEGYGALWHMFEDMTL